MPHSESDMLREPKPETLDTVENQELQKPQPEQATGPEAEKSDEVLAFEDKLRELGDQLQEIERMTRMISGNTAGEAIISLTSSAMGQLDQYPRLYKAIDDLAQFRDSVQRFSESIKQDRFESDEGLQSAMGALREKVTDVEALGYLAENINGKVANLEDRKNEFLRQVGTDFQNLLDHMIHQLAGQADLSRDWELEDIVMKLRTLSGYTDEYTQTVGNVLEGKEGDFRAILEELQGRQEELVNT